MDESCLFCPGCGKTVSPFDKFCRNCGLSLAASTPCRSGGATPDLEDDSCTHYEANPADEERVAEAPIEKELIEFALNDLWRMCSDDPHAALEVISSIDKTGPTGKPATRNARDALHGKWS